MPFAGRLFLEIGNLNQMKNGKKILYRYMLQNRGQPHDVFTKNYNALNEQNLKNI